MSANIKTWQERSEVLPLAMRNDERPFMREEISDLRAALAVADRDAARYRFLADEAWKRKPSLYEGGRAALMIGNHGDALDRAIDAAMSTQEKGEKSE